MGRIQVRPISTKKGEVSMKKNDLSDDIIISAMHRNGYSGLKISEVRDACYEYLCERPVREEMLNPFNKALEDGGIRDDICAFEALINVAHTAESILTDGYVHIILVREWRDGSEGEVQVDNYYLPYTEVAYADGNTFEQKAVKALKTRIDMLLRTADGWKAIVESSFDFNWGDYAMLDVDFSEMPRRGFVERETTVKVNQDEILIPDDILVTVVTACGTFAGTIDGRCGDLIPCETEGSAVDVENADFCTIAFAEGGSLNGAIKGQRFEMVKETHKPKEKKAKKKAVLKNGPLSIEDMKQMAAENDGYIEGAIFIDISFLMDNDFESILDEMSEKLTGGPLLMDIAYEHIPAASSVDTLCFKVSGDASDILREEEGDEDGDDND